jgi:serine/threonine protein kinase
MQSLDKDPVEELVERGFTDRSANLRALTDSQGNVNAATTKLLMQLPNFIGEGRSGKVFFPALQCTDNRNIPSNYVSKLVTEKIADKELKEAVKAEQYLPKDSLYVLDTCESSIKDQKKDQKRDQLVFSRYGGNNLINLLYYELYDGSFDEVKRDFSPNILKYKKILTSLQYLRERVLEMNKKGFYHNDILPENIVYNEEEEKSYLIDFETASNTPILGRNKTSDDIQTMDDIINQLNAFITKLESEIKKYDNPNNPNLYSDDVDYPYPGIFKGVGIKSKKKRKTKKTEKTRTTRKTKKMRKKNRYNI